MSAEATKSANAKGLERLSHNTTKALEDALGFQDVEDAFEKRRASGLASHLVDDKAVCPPANICCFLCMDVLPEGCSPDAND